MNEGIAGIVLLGLIGGGGIIVIDWLVIRKIRRVAEAESRTGQPTQSREDRSIDR